MTEKPRVWKRFRQKHTPFHFCLNAEYVDSKLGQLLSALPKERGILVVVCGDHGENFGEYFAGKPRWGHLFPSPEVMEVPLVIGELNGNR